MSKLALIGAGNMGFAMLSQWVLAAEHEFIIVEPNDALRARAAGLGVKPYASPDDLPSDCCIDVLVIATKPQNVGDVVARYAGMLTSMAVIISVAAGVRLDTISDRAGGDLAVIRAMPNTPAAVGEGMIVCCPNELAKQPSFVSTAETLLSSIGRVAFVEDERMMDAVTAVSGSGPAYVFHFIEALAAAGVAAGLSEDLALILAKQTLFGASKLALESDEAPSSLRERVTSPNGTTAAALDVLMAPSLGLTSLMSAAVDAARKRSIELGT